VISDDRSEMLDLIPAQLRVQVVCRPRYECRACEGTMVQASAPERPIDGGMATEALVAHIVASKFCDSLPLYRQAQMLKREGITLDRSTLSSWVGRACWWLTPLYELLLGTALSTDKCSPRPGSAANRLMCAKPFVNCEVDRWSRICTSGYRTTCRACRAGLIWRKPRAMCCDIGWADPLSR
jgi:transposase